MSENISKRFYAQKAGLVILVLLVCLFAGCYRTTEIRSKEGTIVAPVASISTPEPKYDFRNTYWGMSKEAVKQAEKTELSAEDESAILYSNVNAAGFSADLFYQFDGGALVSGAYMISETHTDYNAYIEDYENSKEALIEVYGTPQKDGVTWSNDVFKQDEQYYGMAVAYGYLSYTSVWITETSTITLGLNGDNFEISHVILYEDLNYTEQINTDGL